MKANSIAGLINCHVSTNVCRGLAYIVSQVLGATVGSSLHVSVICWSAAVLAGH
jgi:hypothetical protein